MFNLEKEYPYTDEDLFKKKYHYQYTDFRGMEFLNAYFLNRKNFLDREALKHDVSTGVVRKSKKNLTNRLVQVLASKTQRSRKIEPPRLNSFNTANLIYALVFLKMTRADAATLQLIDEWLEILQKKFEVSKILKSTYDNRLIPCTEAETTFDSYPLLSFILSIGNELRFLNTVLKLNDLIIAKINKNYCELSGIATRLAIQQELKTIKLLSRKHGIK